MSKWEPNEWKVSNSPSVAALFLSLIFAKLPDCVCTIFDHALSRGDNHFCQISFFVTVFWGLFWQKNEVCPIFIKIWSLPFSTMLFHVVGSVFTKYQFLVYFWGVQLFWYSQKWPKFKVCPIFIKIWSLPFMTTLFHWVRFELVKSHFLVSFE